MKADYKIVQLDVYPGGIHGLSNEPQVDADITSDMRNAGNKGLSDVAIQQ
jgi:hypothetical protein